MGNGERVTDSVFEKILSWIPGWLGFLLLILLGTAAILLEAFASWPGTGWGYVGGAWAVVVPALFWISGATSTIEGRVGTVGVLVSVSDIPTWAWIVNTVLTVVAFVGGWLILR